MDDLIKDAGAEWGWLMDLPYREAAFILATVDRIRAEMDSENDSQGDLR